MRAAADPPPYAGAGQGQVATARYHRLRW